MFHAKDCLSPRARISRRVLPFGNPSARLTLPKRFAAGLIAGCLLSQGAAVHAAPPAIVDEMAAPAWVLRDGRRIPAAPGMALRAGEIVATGPGSRVWLGLGDGSRVKLGENARFFVADATDARAGKGVFQATLRVVRGAFRFTTALAARVAAPRRVTIQLPTVTIGLRGTDLWGRAAEDREFVVLIEGSISVQRGAGEAVVLDRPLAVFEATGTAPEGGSIAAVAPDVLAAYAAETEIPAGAGRQVPGGRWKVTALSTRSPDEALGMYDRLRADGYPAVIEPRGRGEDVLYRVRIVRIATRSEAEGLATRLARAFGLESASVSR